MTTSFHYCFVFFSFFSFKSNIFSTINLFILNEFCFSIHFFCALRTIISSVCVSLSALVNFPRNHNIQECVKLKCISSAKIKETKGPLINIKNRLKTLKYARNLCMCLRETKTKINAVNGKVLKSIE